MIKTSRVGIIVYLYYIRDARKLAKYGDLIYQSRRFRYALLYANASDVEVIVSELNGFKWVKSATVSPLDTINQDFVGSLYR